MKRMNAFTSCIFLLLVCCITCIVTAYSSPTTLNATINSDSISLQTLIEKQQALLLKIQNLNQGLTNISAQLKGYNEKVSSLEKDLSSTQKLLISYYIDKLSDSSYTTTYNSDYTWYTAAEALGEIGKPAIPALIQRLNTTTNSYETSLIFYSLLLASQAENVKVFAGDDYIQTYLDLDNASHNSQKQIALEWWNKYKSYF